MAGPRFQSLSDRRHPAARKGDVGHGVKLLGRVDHPSAAQIRSKGMVVPGRKKSRRHCERSEAIHCRARGVDCFVAYAPRNDDVTRSCRYSRTSASPGRRARRSAICARRSARDIGRAGCRSPGRRLPSGFRRRSSSAPPARWSAQRHRFSSLDLGILGPAEPAAILAPAADREVDNRVHHVGARPSW